jgi:hypothetical protein
MQQHDGRTVSDVLVIQLDRSTQAIRFYLQHAHGFLLSSDEINVVAMKAVSPQALGNVSCTPGSLRRRF